MFEQSFESIGDILHWKDLGGDYKNDKFVYMF